MRRGAFYLYPTSNLLTYCIVIKTFETVYPTQEVAYDLIYLMNPDCFINIVKEFFTPLFVFPRSRGDRFQWVHRQTKSNEWGPEAGVYLYRHRPQPHGVRDLPGRPHRWIKGMWVNVKQRYSLSEITVESNLLGPDFVDWRFFGSLKSVGIFCFFRMLSFPVSVRKLTLSQFIFVEDVISRVIMNTTENEAPRILNCCGIHSSIKQSCSLFETTLF